MGKDTLIERLAVIAWEQTAIYGREQMPYANLNEGDKAQLRRAVMAYYPTVVSFVAAWIADYHDDIMRDSLAEQWREEMT